MVQCGNDADMHKGFSGRGGVWSVLRYVVDFELSGLCWIGMGCGMHDGKRWIRCDS